MKKQTFSLNQKDPDLQEIVEKTDKRNLAIWALACAARIFPYFESQFPEDPQPVQALAALQDRMDTGEFNMKTIRGAALVSMRLPEKSVRIPLLALQLEQKGSPSQRLM